MGALCVSQNKNDLTTPISEGKKSFSGSEQTKCINDLAKRKQLLKDVEGKLEQNRHDTIVKARSQMQSGNINNAKILMRVKKAYDINIGKALNMQHLIDITISEIQNKNHQSNKPALDTIHQADRTVKELKDTRNLLETVQSSVNLYVEDQQALGRVLHDDSYSEKEIMEDLYSLSPKGNFTRLSSDIPSQSQDSISLDMPGIPENHRAQLSIEDRREKKLALQVV